MTILSKELHKAKLQVLNFVVDPEFRRQTIGEQMVKKLVDKLSQQRRQEIVLEVRETNLQAQLFFKRMGFRAVLVLCGHYDDTDEDAYVMRLTLEEEDVSWALPFSNPQSAFHITNRISEYDVA